MKKTRSKNLSSGLVDSSTDCKEQTPGSDPRLLVNILAKQKSQRFLIESVSTDLLDSSSDCVEITLRTTRGDFYFWVTTKHGRKDGSVLLQTGPMVSVGEF